MCSHITWPRPSDLLPLSPWPRSPECPQLSTAPQKIPSPDSPRLSCPHLDGSAHRAHLCLHIPRNPQTPLYLSHLAPSSVATSSTHSCFNCSSWLWPGRPSQSHLISQSGDSPGLGSRPHEVQGGAHVVLLQSRWRPCQPMPACEAPEGLGSRTALLAQGSRLTCITAFPTATVPHPPPGLCTPLF